MKLTYLTLQIHEVKYWDAVKRRVTTTLFCTVCSLLACHCTCFQERKHAVNYSLCKCRATALLRASVALMWQMCASSHCTTLQHVIKPLRCAMSTRQRKVSKCTSWWPIFRTSPTIIWDLHLLACKRILERIVIPDFLMYSCMQCF